MRTKVLIVALFIVLAAGCGERPASRLTGPPSIEEAQFVVQKMPDYRRFIRCYRIECVKETPSFVDISPVSAQFPPAGFKLSHLCLYENSKWEIVSVFLSDGRPPKAVFKDVIARPLVVQAKPTPKKPAAKPVKPRVKKDCRSSSPRHLYWWPGSGAQSGVKRDP